MDSRIAGRLFHISREIGWLPGSRRSTHGCTAQSAPLATLPLRFDGRFRVRRYKCLFEFFAGPSVACICKGMSHPSRPERSYPCLPCAIVPESCSQQKSLDVTSVWVPSHRSLEQESIADVILLQPGVLVARRDDGTTREARSGKCWLAAGHNIDTDSARPRRLRGLR